MQAPAHPPPAASAPAAAAPRGDEGEGRSPLLRSQDGGVSQAPAFLQASTTPVADEGERKPRTRTRKRAPRSFEAGEGGEVAPAGAEEEA